MRKGYQEPLLLTVTPRPCSGDLPKCKRCESTGLNCEYTPTRRRFANVRFNSPKLEDTPPSALQPAKPEGTVSPTSSAGSVAGTSTSIGNVNIAMPLMDASALMAEEYLVRKDIILTHFDAYMQYLYWVPCLGFMHPEMTYQEIQENRFPPAQAAAVCAVSSFFVNPGEAGREFGKKYSVMVESHIYRNIYKFSEDALILFALNILFHLLDGSFAKVWQCFGVASRLMIGLQLNWDVLSPDTSFVQQESIRRIAWQLFGLDRLLAGGYEEYICCRAENMKIRLPCNEAAYRENRPVIAERLHDKPGKFPNTIGLHGIQIRLIDLRHRIQVVTRKLAAPHGANVSHLEPSKVMADINALQNELTRLHASIPDDLRLSDQSISRYAQSERWMGYVYFHTHMAGCHMDLYGFSLPGHRDPAAIEILRKLPKEFLARSQKQAVAHSMCLARFFDAVRNETENIPNQGNVKLVGDYSVTHMATHCIQILLIALQYNLHQDLADHTTAPLWRSGPTSEVQIRAFIDTMLEITEPWSRVIEVTRVAHESSKAVVEYFDRTRKVVDRPHMPMIPDRNATEDSRLPGPHIILEKAGGSSPEEEHKNRAGDMPVSDWWMGPGTPQQPSPSSASSLPVSFPVSDVSVDVDYGPPGVPQFLAQARGAPMGIFDFTENPNLAISDRTGWTSPELGGMLPSTYQFIQPPQATADDMSMIRMDGASPDPGMFHQQQVPHEQQQQPFMPPQQGIFVNGYTGQYPAGHAETHAYMQHHNFA
ncbi:hypothetical protein PT974_08258 [Cladobotryum mycophilum]|uniref:Xylanolytic transcriptional activator regulatory domain-containing protein n=1 Tax=Cladobotryum mycophilum TaxID=491253 RepID=A0ABR0SCW2_9HYPO